MVRIGLFVLLSMNVSCDLTNGHKKSTLNEAIDTLQFIEYKEFESVYKSGQDVRKFARDLSLFSFLLLDSAIAKGFFKSDSREASEFQSYSNNARLSKSTVGFVSGSEALREVFLSKKSRDRILNCIYSEESLSIDRMKFLGPVYIRDNTAVVLISNLSGFNRYIITLVDGVVQINWVGGSIE